jgi:hypothetical protein|nr:MAG TPA: hypothetical protein [Caudoviricetes sp.]
MYKFMDSHNNKPFAKEAIYCIYDDSIVLIYKNISIIDILGNSDI